MELNCLRAYDDSLKLSSVCASDLAGKSNFDCDVLGLGLSVLHFVAPSKLLFSDSRRECCC
jgi:hypothetical protein